VGKLKAALIRAVRTFLQSLAGSLAAIPAVETVADIQVRGSGILVALYVAFFAAVVSFLQNAAEALGGLDVPRG
jgi:hypothetical protein